MKKVNLLLFAILFVIAGNVFAQSNKVFNLNDLDEATVSAYAPASIGSFQYLFVDGYSALYAVDDKILRKIESVRDNTSVVYIIVNQNVLIEVFPKNDQVKEKVSGDKYKTVPASFIQQIIKNK